MKWNFKINLKHKTTSVTATGFEPTIAYFVNEHSII